MKRWWVEPFKPEDEVIPVFKRLNYVTFDNKVCSSQVVFLTEDEKEDRAMLARFLREARRQCEIHRRLQAKGQIK